jgi:predicted hydrocarbon binding protein
MLMSGIITRDKGINYMWHNPFIFLPSKAFAQFYDCLQKNVGRAEIDEFFYWLGLLQGRNSTRMLKNRFGIDKKKFQDFIDGATIIGMGELTLLEHDEEVTFATIEGKNSVLALRLKESNPKINHDVDAYLCGIIAGGFEIITERAAICVEKKCMAKGDDCCLYAVRQSDECKFPTIKEKLSELLTFEEKITKYYLHKEPYLKVSLNKQFDLQRGAFFLHNIEGFNIEVYLMLLIELYFRQHHNKVYDEALQVLFKEICLEFISKKHYQWNETEIIALFKEVSLIGFGELSFRHGNNYKVIFELKNDVLLSESKAIFHSKKIISGETVALFIKTVLEHTFQRSFEVKKIDSSTYSLFQVDY